MMWRATVGACAAVLLTQLRLGFLEDTTARSVACLRSDFVYRGYVTCFDCGAAAASAHPQCEYVNAFYCVEVPLRRGLINHPPYLYLAMSPICTLAFLWGACAPFVIYGRGTRALVASMIRVVLLGGCIFILNLGRFWLFHALMLADFARLWTHDAPLWAIIFAVVSAVICNYRRANRPRPATVIAIATAANDGILHPA